MACEKLCKGYLIDRGAPPDSVQTSHGFIANPLPVVIREELRRRGVSTAQMKAILKKVRHLAAEIELLSPSVDRDGRRPDNCEYPWAVGDRVLSPLDQTFAAKALCEEHMGRTFLKLLRAAISNLL